MVPFMQYLQAFSRRCAVLGCPPKSARKRRLVSRNDAKTGRRPGRAEPPAAVGTSCRYRGTVGGRWRARRDRRCPQLRGRTRVRPYAYERTPCLPRTTLTSLRHRWQHQRHRKTESKGQESNDQVTSHREQHARSCQASYWRSCRRHCRSTRTTRRTDCTGT